MSSFRMRDGTGFSHLPARRGQELLTELDTFLTRLAAVRAAATRDGNTASESTFLKISHIAQTAIWIKTMLYEERSARVAPAMEEIDVLAGLNQKK